MDWDDIKIFLAVVRDGNVRAAAKKLGVSHSTVARRIDAMEGKFAVRLFDRLPAGYAVTPAGEDMLRVAEGVESEFDALERRIVGHDRQLAGHIRVTMVDALATKLLMPHLVDFTRSYPNIDLELMVTYDVLDLDRREADIALRFTRSPPDHLVGRPLLTVATAAYASEDYLIDRDLQNPSTAQWIGFSAEPFPKWVKNTDFPRIPVKGQFMSLLVQLEACKAGMGVGMLPCFLGDTEPSLRRLSSPERKPDHELWLLTHSDVRTTARFRVLSDFIVAAIKNHRALMEGGSRDH